MLSRYCRFGLSAALLYKEMADGPLGHLAGFSKAAALKDYEVLETSLCDDPNIRKEELKIAREEGKSISYNIPVDIQVPGAYNPCSFDIKERKNAAAFVKRHIDYAKEAGCGWVLLTSGPDYQRDRREEEKDNLAEFYAEIGPYAERNGIIICIEPTERERFKKQLLGPTVECVDFVKRLHGMKECGCVYLMIDTAHYPLMEEDALEGLRMMRQVGGAKYVHVGNAVMDPSSIFYGHTHPPVGLQGGLVDYKELSGFFMALFEVGYLKRDVAWDNRPCVSYEMKPYPGVPEELSAAFAYAKANSAMELALYG